MQHCDALYKHCRGQLTHSSRLVLTEIFTAIRGDDTDGYRAASKLAQRAHL